MYKLEQKYYLFQDLIKKLDEPPTKNLNGICLVQDAVILSDGVDVDAPGEYSHQHLIQLSMLTNI